MKKALLLLALLISSFSRAQTNSCATDFLKQVQSERNSFYQKEEAEFNRTIYHHLLSNLSFRSSGSIVTIPVVFHVIHNNGPENIDDSLIINSVTQLNLRFQNSAPYFDSTGHPVNIQFCLASVDPWGNSTSGITRNVSTLTALDLTDDITLKNIIRWSPELYLNIWLTSSIYYENHGFLSGYSNYPWNAGSASDGIVVIASSINSTVLTHEVGHYLGLYHTFEGGCQNENCLLNGDHVCDTPPDNIQGSCNVNSCTTEMDDTSGFNPFVADMFDLPNYMDYTTCPNSFSQGQADRMNISLTTYRPTLLQSNGCGSNPGGTVPVASFILDSTYCSGSVHLINTSSNSFTANWDFDNDGIYDQMGNDIVHSFSSSGFYNIKMLVSGYGGSDTLTQGVFIHVPPDSLYPVSTVTGNIFPNFNNQEPTTCRGTLISIHGAPGMTSYHWSTGDTTQDITFPATETFSITLTATDSTGFTWKNCIPISALVDTITPIISGPDSVTCGQLTTFSITPNYSSGWYVNNVFVETSSTFQTTFWNAGALTIWAISYDENNCPLNSDTVHVVVPPPPAINLNLSGDTLSFINNQPCFSLVWYYNGSFIPSASSDYYVATQPGCYFVSCYYCQLSYSDTICLTNVGVADQSVLSNALQIFPNPTTGQFQIESDNIQISNVKLFTPVGELIYSENFQTTQVSIDISHEPKGIYFTKVTDENGNVFNRILTLH